MFRLFFGRVGSFLGLPRGVSCLGAEFVPVVSIVADEVGDFVEGLIQDGLLEGHVFGMGEVVLMMMNYEGGGVVVLWWLVLGGKSPFECGVKWDNRKDGVFVVFSFLAGKIAYSHEIFWGFAEESSHEGRTSMRVRVFHT